MELLANGWNILLIVLGFGLLIFVHELGHFLAARWAGIRCESFAVGLGPQVLAYRSGIGVVAGSTDARTVARFGKTALQMTDEELQRLGVGETEYSLRALPLGGFVRMLGQDDLAPTATSTQARSYQRTPVWKRMIVVSAGVVANLIFAVALFIVAFMVGVQFEAPVVGSVLPGKAAATALRVGGGAPGLMSGDRVLSIDGQPVQTFADLQLAGAMSREGTPLELRVERRGADGAQDLTFTAIPTKDRGTRMLSLGVEPARSTVLMEASDEGAEVYALELRNAGLAHAGVIAGSELRLIDGKPAFGARALEFAAERSNGNPISTAWRLPAGAEVTVMLAPRPQYQRLMGPPSTQAGVRTQELQSGLLGWAPLTRINGTLKDSPNRTRFQPGDVVLRVGDLAGPRREQFVAALGAAAGRSIPVEVLRAGERITVEAVVDRLGKIGIWLGDAWDSPLLARTMDSLAATLPSAQQDSEAAAISAGERGAEGNVGAAATTTDTAEAPSPAAALQFLPLTRLSMVAEMPVHDWASFRAALLSATHEAAQQTRGATIQIGAIAPTPGKESIRGTLTLDAAQVHALHMLGWESPVNPALFQPLMTTLSAGGNPLEAAAMGFRQTRTMVVMTYLTLDRIARGSIGAEQLRGPVGIVHLGTRVADRGATYLIFFLAMISVNLAVLNFLPLPIVDGGLFLYLLYERFTGRPPSPAFINAATMAGLLLLGGVFLFTFYNDVMRLVSGG